MCTFVSTDGKTSFIPPVLSCYSLFSPSILVSNLVSLHSNSARHSFVCSFICLFPTGIFLSVVTVSFCVVMAIGYYHQYTSSAFARRLQVLPHVSYINQDQTHEVCFLINKLFFSVTYAIIHLLATSK